MQRQLEDTGERFIPGRTLSAWTEAYHVSRYRFALEFAKGKRVLDLGCGVGYGAALLAQVAKSVLGGDVSQETLQFARKEYVASNLQFVQMDCRRLGLPANAFDLVVSFEVIEHVLEQEEMLSEVERVLADTGTFIVSTPERARYGLASRPNEYHVRELSESELSELLGSYFSNVEVLWQVVDPLAIQVIHQSSQIAALQARVAALEVTIRKPWLRLARLLVPRTIRGLVRRRVKKKAPDTGLRTHDADRIRLPKPEHVSFSSEPTAEAIYMVATCQK
jgi:ubiquinone/menaquinone biosynthesis C-methylase UbiE